MTTYESPTLEAHTPDRDLTAIVVGTQGFANVEFILRALEIQSARARMVILIVGPEPERAGVPTDWESAAKGRRYLCVAEGGTIAQARALAVSSVTTPYLAFFEDHCFPEPTWVETLVPRLQQGHAGAGPAILNGNGSSRLSWAMTLIEYGPWIDPHPGGEVEHLPGHNSAFQVAPIMEYEDDLPTLLEAESNLHFLLREDGHSLEIFPGARSTHFNISRWGPALLTRFGNGHVFALNRRAQWPLWKRLGYAAAGPLIPLVRFARIRQDLARAARLHSVPKGSGALAFVLLCVDALGEMTGYLGRLSWIQGYMSDIEYDRWKLMRPADREIFRHFGMDAATERVARG